MNTEQNKQDRIALGFDPTHVFVLFRRFTYAHGAYKWKRFGADEWQSERAAKAAVIELRNAHPNHCYSVRRKKI